MDRDPVDPRLQAGLTVKVLHAAKHLQEDFLRGVRGVCRIADDPVHQAVDGLVELTDEPGVGVLRAGL